MVIGKVIHLGGLVGTQTDEKYSWLLWFPLINSATVLIDWKEKEYI